MASLEWITPDWPAPRSVRAVSTMRAGGFSEGCYSGFNLGLHVGDRAWHVEQNHRLLRETLELLDEPCWLEQQHGTRVIRLPAPEGETFRADAAYTTVAGTVCAVQTADCLPVLFCDRLGSCVGVAHGGWRGLFGGVLENTVRALAVPPSQLLCWLGPAIGPARFEVGEALREQFIAKDDSLAPAFTPVRPGKYLADLYCIATSLLAAQGVHAVSGGMHCTHTEGEKFFSYRRDGTTGRQATLIWLQAQRNPPGA